MKMKIVKDVRFELTKVKTRILPTPMKSEKLQNCMETSNLKSPEYPHPNGKFAELDKRLQILGVPEYPRYLGKRGENICGD